MFRPLAVHIEQLDNAYRDRPYFVGLKARLLVGFGLFMLLFWPLNAVKLLWIHSPMLPLRLGFNLLIWLAALVCVRLVQKGRLELAGNILVIASVLPVSALVFLVPVYPEPLGTAFQMFVFGLGFLLLALVFASRWVAGGVLAIVVTSHVFFYLRAFNTDHIQGSIGFAAGIFLRDGLFAIGFIFCLGLVLVRMIDAAYDRSERSLRETRALNENLEQLVAERTRDLEAATRMANQASQAKGDFLANMSHEIRTPLNGIIASADLLRHRVDLSTAAAEHVRLISESGELLLRQIGDILDFSKIEAGHFWLETHPFELAPLVADCLGLVATKAAQEGMRLDCAVDPVLSRNFEGDSFRLRQVLLNLVSNAIKFTPSGGQVRLTVTSAAPNSDPTPVRFEVRDTGIGMDEATLKRVFGRFTQADSSTTRRYGGTGLGLAISSRIVEMMGGRIEAESTPGQGSVFCFIVPLRAVAAPRAVVAPDQPAARLGLRVLVAEDNAVNRKIISAQLDELGCSHTMAVDGEEVLAALQHDPLPDVILMDCHMPKMDGWEATRRLRQWAYDPDASPLRRQASARPVIALTAAALTEERTRCLAAGMNDFLAKPVKLAELRRSLQPFVRA